MSQYVHPAEALSDFLDGQPELTAITVAYSGGLDSHVLLHLVSSLPTLRPDIAIRAIHINHQLQTQSDDWARHAQLVCSELDIPLTVVEVDVSRQHSDGPEASARLARYAAFAEHLQAGEHMLLAQHSDDQAETFLLQALRGSGPDGLASIPRKRTFADGFMSRPLLNCSREQLEGYAETNGLNHIHDVSNDDTSFDRNYLRHEIMPLLKARWPAAARTLSRSANRCSAASQTLLGLAQEDLKLVKMRGASQLSVSEIKSLSRERAYNVLRLWVRQSGLRMPRLQDLAEVHRQLVNSRADSQGIVNVRDYEFRRHKDRLYLLPPQEEPKAFHHDWEAPFLPLSIPEIGQTLTREDCVRQGIRLPSHGAMTVRSRVGSELIKLGEPAFHKAVKKLLQEASVPPWQRDVTPLLYIDGRLAAVWEIAVAVDFRQGATKSSEVV